VARSRCDCVPPHTSRLREKKRSVADVPVAKNNKKNPAFEPAGRQRPDHPDEPMIRSLPNRTDNFLALLRAAGHEKKLPLPRQKDRRNDALSQPFSNEVRGKVRGGKDDRARPGYLDLTDTDLTPPAGGMRLHKSSSCSRSACFSH
jgi:hypothetical protein